MIKMIAGVYGMKVTRPDGSTYVKAMGVGDGSFSLEPEKEKELVKNGFARFVEPVDDIKPLDELTAKELREIGKSHGISLKVGLTKAEMVAIIAAKLANTPDVDKSDKSDNSEDNNISDESYSEDDCITDLVDENEEAGEEATDEDAPTFDAAEAVK
jgi:hypothetical protein